MSVQLLIDVAGPIADATGQWWTPPELARSVVEWARVNVGMRVLEPAAGTGALLDPLTPLLEHRSIDVVAYELDAQVAVELRARHGVYVEIRERDFLADLSPGRFDVVVMNAPYEDDRDLAFAQRALEVAPRVVAIVRDAFPYSLARQALWRWAQLERLVFLGRRPRFGGRYAARSTGPESDFMVVELTRRTSPRAAHEADRPTVEWWW